ncbi:hypothetical protein [Micromonospora sp. NPDC092111]|uniref:hypothetical protein n=1 Tax=Micromonospora sp. NPDC092111 TaxID=3364289 RepID=UPI00381AA33C
MGERGESVRYVYWSDRRVRSIAVDDGIDIVPRWKTKIALFKIPPLHTGVDLEREPRALHRKEVAGRIERAIGDLAVEDFVTPPPVRYARGVGRVEFSHFVCEEQDRVVLGARSVASDGTRVALCLFGSRHNVADFIGPHDAVASGWTSSSMWSITRWLAERCAASGLRHDDPQSISVEAMKIAFDQGSTRESRDASDQPWRRGYTFGDAPDAEWFAEIYSDVVLDKDRWGLDEPVDRILVGAPLWVRTPRAAVRRYRDLRRGINVKRYK